MDDLAKLSDVLEAYRQLNSTVPSHGLTNDLTALQSRQVALDDVEFQEKRLRQRLVRRS